MLRSAAQLFGHRLTAADGDLGHVTDLFFDDQEWAIRYLIVKTGSWLSDRHVLISPRSVDRIDDHGKMLLAGLTRKQVEACPLIDTQKPISRQYEEAYHQHYGYSYYWQGNALWGTSAYPMVLPIPEPVPAGSRNDVVTGVRNAVPHLRSMVEIIGYHLQAQDGTIGKLSDTMFDERSWAIRRLAIETGHWYAGKKVFLLPQHVDRISYDDAVISVNLNLADISGTARNEVAQLGYVNE